MENTKETKKFNIDLEKQSAVFAAGNSITLQTNSNSVMFGNNLIIFPFKDKKEYIYTLTIRNKE